MQYNMDKFTKNKRYHKYPIELVYNRKIDVVHKITDDDQEANAAELSRQIFKIYAEGCEI